MPSPRNVRSAPPYWQPPAFYWLAVLGFIYACSDPAPKEGAEPDLPEVTVEADAVAPNDTPAPEDTEAPDEDIAEPEPEPMHGPVERGLVGLRGLVHMHSTFSHDACDGEPLDENGEPQQHCLDRIRDALCTCDIDFMWLTDHPSHMKEFPWERVTLYDETHGDELVDGVNHMACEAGLGPWVFAGFERGHRMGVGMRRHMVGDGVYDDGFADANTLEHDKGLMAAVRDAGGLAFVDHLEDEDLGAQRMLEIPVDGIEVYNLHPNTLAALNNPDNPAKGHLGAFLADTETDPFFVIMILWPALNQEPLEKWDIMLNAGARPTAFAGSDLHENVPFVLPDGERIDAYARAMRWFSNVAFVDEDTPDAITAAMRSGRSMLSFDAFGAPQAVDFHGRAGETIVEMGGEHVGELDLVVTNPTVGLVPGTAPQPDLDDPLIATVKSTVVDSNGQTVLELDGQGATGTVHVGKGVYRLIVTIEPHHVASALGLAAELATLTYPFVWTNPIYVR